MMNRIRMFPPLPGQSEESIVSLLNILIIIILSNTSHSSLVKHLLAFMHIQLQLYQETVVQLNHHLLVFPLALHLDQLLHSLYVAN